MMMNKIQVESVLGQIGNRDFPDLSSLIMFKSKHSNILMEEDMNTENIPRNEHFNQVCVWEGCLVGEKVGEFPVFMQQTFGIRIQYLEEIVTLPGDGGEGGRNDVFFAVHEDDIETFAIKRLQVGIRWIEDVLSSVNYRDAIYPKRVFGYKSWEADESFTIRDIPISTSTKPQAKIIGANGNIFNILAIAKSVLDKSKGDEMFQRATACQGYDDALAVIMEYVEPIEVE